jgi:hypothetical protein
MVGIRKLSTANTGYYFYPNNVAGGSIYFVAGVTTGVQSPVVVAASQSLQLLVVQKAAGGLLYISTDGGLRYSLLWVEDAVVDPTYEIAYRNYSAAFTSSRATVFLTVPRSPVISATPTAPTPTLGGELAAGALTVGVWYSITATEANHFFVGCAIGNTFLAAATTGLDANNKVKPITLSTCFAIAGDAGTREGIFDAAATLTAGTQAGVACCVDDETNPTYGLLAVHDGTKAHLYKYEAGTPTELTSGTLAYAAGAVPRIVTVGTSVGCYYNGAICGTIQTVANIASYGTKVCGVSMLAANAPGLIVAQTGGNASELGVPA